MAMKSDSGENNDHDQPEKINNDETRPGRTYDCTFCKRGFTNAQALGGHMNIHRKDKAKTKESKSPPTKSLNHFSLSTISSSEVPNNNNNNPGLAQSPYQDYYLPPFHSYQPQYNPANFDASRPEQRGHGEDHGELDLSLNVGVNNDDEYCGRRNENEDENEVDLELRLGNHPR